MKTSTKEVRAAVKDLIVRIGFNNIIGQHINEVVESLDCTHCDVQNALSYFKYSPTQGKFRECYF